jgi:hypothetical protein
MQYPGFFGHHVTVRISLGLIVILYRSELNLPSILGHFSERTFLVTALETHPKHYFPSHFLQPRN